MRMRPNCCKEKNREGEVTRILSAVKAVRLYETVQFALFWSFYAGRNPQCGPGLLFAFQTQSKVAVYLPLGLLVPRLSLGTQLFRQLCCAAST